MVPPLEAVVAHGNAVLLKEGSSDGRSGELGGGDKHSIELAEACD